MIIVAGDARSLDAWIAVMDIWRHNDVRHLATPTLM